MKLAYPIDTMLQVEVVGGTPNGGIVAVELARVREAWASILESGRWLKIRAGYGQDLSGFVVHLQTNVEEIRPNEIVYWMNALVPDEQEPKNFLLGNAEENQDIAWWVVSLGRRARTRIIWMFHRDALRAWEESKLNALPGVTIYHLGAKAAVGPMLVRVLVGVGHHRGELGIGVGLANKPSPFLAAALVADSRLGWRMTANASAEAQAAVMLSRDGEDPNAPVLSVAIGW
jgi:hypothetical protein